MRLMAKNNIYVLIYITSTLTVMLVRMAIDK